MLHKLEGIVHIAPETRDVVSRPQESLTSIEYLNPPLTVGGDKFLKLDSRWMAIL